jgi:hypothetical protein
MKIRIFVMFVIFITVLMSAGCTQGPGFATPGPTPEQTTAATAVPTISAPKPSFSLGDHYLKKSYSFQSEKDVYREDVRVDNTSWGIAFDVLPLTGNITDSWFTLKVINMNTGQTETYGYGRTFGSELHHLIPMYTPGPYRIEMSGYLTKVDVVLAKRNP